jgi:hypothetical protein
MEKDSRKYQVDRDGVRMFESTGRRARLGPWMVAALLVAILGAVAASNFRREPVAPSAKVSSAVQREQASVPPGEAPAQQRADETLPAVAASRAQGFRAIHVDRPARAPKDAHAEHAEKDPERTGDAQLEALAREMIQAAADAGETKGIAAFPPPGTDPIKIGLIVPDDFELPEGYLRHYQVTDDGRRLQPILMFSPDYEFQDAGGQPVPLPKDGIVPPEMAPPGMPLRKLEMPKHPYGAPVAPLGSR